MAVFVSTNVISKKLNEQIDTSQVVTPVGKAFPEASPVGARLVSHEQITPLTTKDSFDLDGDGKADLVQLRWKTPGVACVRETDLRSNVSRTYVARTQSDGRLGPVTHYTEETPRGSLIQSADWKTGKLDWVSESVSRIPGFKVDGYAPDWKGSVVWSRVLEDTNHDGKFDTESVTGDWHRYEDRD
jgi:hypothetical protein